MISSVVLGSITLKCNYVNKPIRPNIVRVQVPGRSTGLVQNMGKASKEVMLRGIISEASKDTDKSTLESYRGTNQTYTDSDESFTMVVEVVDIPTVGGNPNHYEFTITGVKYEQT